MDDNKAVLEEIETQVQRSGPIFRRFWRGWWPLLIPPAILIVLLPLVNLAPESLQEKVVPLALETIAISIALIAPLLFWRSIIFSIQKRVWIDSYFDGKNLSPDESWKLSKKIAWPSIKFFLLLIWRYFIIKVIFIYLFGIIVFLIIPRGRVFLNEFSTSSIIPYLFGIFIFLPLIILSIVIFSIGIKNRYFFLVFLDLYGGKDFSFTEVFKDIRELNELDEELIKKPIAATVTKIENEYITRGVGQILSGYNNTHPLQFKNIIIRYFLYRYARELLGRPPQVVNENLYRLIGK